MGGPPCGRVIALTAGSNGGFVSEEINQGRRRFFGAAAMTVATAQFGMTALADGRPCVNENVVRDAANRLETAEVNAAVVLVHGAWADGSSWARVITPLQS